MGCTRGESQGTAIIKLLPSVNKGVYSGFEIKGRQRQKGETKYTTKVHY